LTVANQIVLQRGARLRKVFGVHYPGPVSSEQSVTWKALEAAYTEGANVALETCNSMLDEPKATALRVMLRGEGAKGEMTQASLKMERDRLLARVIEINRTLTRMAATPESDTGHEG
jgi:hypothetical protein